MDMLKKRKDLSKKLLYGFIGLAIIFGLFLGIYFGDYLNFLKYNHSDNSEKIKISLEPFVPEEGVAYISVPAIGPEGEGVSTLLAVKAEEGIGRTLVDIDSLLFWVDTQNSIRIAKNVAENITGLNTDLYDMTFSIVANASLIGGESAGAALALASIAALTGNKLRSDVMITGAVNHDGSIGPIGGVLEKARAAKDVNASLLLVPLLQSSEIVYTESEHCEKYGFMEWCTTERIPEKIDISQDIGIDVREVGSIQEAYKYFLEKEVI